MHESVEGEASVDLGDAKVLHKQFAVVAALIVFNKEVWSPGTETFFERRQVAAGNLRLEPLLRAWRVRPGVLACRIWDDSEAEGS